MNQVQLAKKILYMQRDYSNKEISELLEMRLEDVTTLISRFQAGTLEETKEEEDPKPQGRKKAAKSPPK
jgi:hypothetical protein